jgi:SAM-dependent methyltransferase
MPGLTAERYGSWYRTPWGRWIGQLEYRLMLRLLRPGPEESILDVGCGTGYFTRRFARKQMAAVTGVDTDPEAIGYARLHAANRESYLVGSGEELPFPVGAFDLSVSIAAMCFVRNQVVFLREMARFTRRSLAVGLLNRNSLLWRREGFSSHLLSGQAARERPGSEAYAGEGLLAESAALSKGLNGPVRKRCGQIRSSSITAPTCA